VCVLSMGDAFVEVQTGNHRHVLFAKLLCTAQKSLAGNKHLSRSNDKCLCTLTLSEGPLSNCSLFIMVTTSIKTKAANVSRFKSKLWYSTTCKHCTHGDAHSAAVTALHK